MAFIVIVGSFIVVVIFCYIISVIITSNHALKIPHNGTIAVNSFIHILRARNYAKVVSVAFISRNCLKSAIFNIEKKKHHRKLTDISTIKGQLLEFFDFTAQIINNNVQFTFFHLFLDFSESVSTASCKKFTRKSVDWKPARKKKLRKGHF